MIALSVWIGPVAFEKGEIAESLADLQSLYAGAEAHDQADACSKSA